MKPINFLLALVSCWALASCNASSDLEVLNLGDLTSQSLGEASSSERTSDEIEELALRVASQLRFPNELRSSRRLAVASSYRLRETQQTLRSSTLPQQVNLHVVEFSEDNGYALVSGSKMDPGVLYISERGRFSKTFYDRYLAEPIGNYMKRGRPLGTGYYCPFGCINSDICRNTNHPTPSLEFFCPMGCPNRLVCPHESTTTDTTTVNLPYPITGNLIVQLPSCKVLRGKNNLLKTNWSLWDPLNLEAPIVKWTDEQGNVHEGRAFIGCNAVAIMQLLAYHQYPNILGGNSIPWDRFREMDEFEGHDRTLIAQVARYVADEIKSTYGINNSRETAAYNTDVKDFLMRIGYQNYSSLPYDIDEVKRELDQNRPILISAAVKGAYIGHIWIIDGYKEMRYVTPSDTVVYDFVHCNWGFAKYENQGYCLSKIFHKTQQYLNVEHELPNVDTIPNDNAYVSRCTIYTGIAPKIKTQ